MLRKFRIEVEEESPDKCVETLSKYEHALHAQEVKRYAHYFPVSIRQDGVKTEDEKRLEELDHDWSEHVYDRSFFNGELGREVIEEVIEYDPTLPGYKGRRVVAFTRIDTRPPAYAFQFQVNPETNHWDSLAPYNNAQSASSGGPPVPHPQRGQDLSS